MYIGIILSGLQVGNVAAFLFSPAILEQTSWSGLLIVYGLLGLVWIGLWLPSASDQPLVPLPPSSYTTAAAALSNKNMVKTAPIIQSKNTNLLNIKNPIRTTATDITTTEKIPITKKEFNIKTFLSDIPFTEIIQSKSVQSIAVAHSVQNFGLYINLSWLPTYFNEKFDLSVSDSSLASVLPWVAGAIVGPLSGTYTNFICIYLFIYISLFTYLCYL